jgi:glycosyltransferase involved in cell wall biosynthesis
MRVLHAYKVYAPGLYGGIPSIIAMLAHLSRYGIDTRILVARDLGRAVEYEMDGIPVNAVSSMGTFMSMPLAPTYPFHFAREAKHFDVVVHHAPFPLTDVGILFMPKNVQLVVHWHAEVVGRSLLTKLLSPIIRHTLRRADCIVVGDRSLIDSSPFLRPFVDKCVVIPYACDVDYWSELDDSQRKEAEDIRKAYPRLVLTIGRLVGYKGHEILLQAMQKIDAQAVIIGDGPLKESLNELAVTLGVQDRVKFVGQIPPHRAKQYIHAAKVFAFPSVTEAESFGIVQIEAMSAALPIVNTDIPTGVPNVARDGKEGLTVPRNRPDALATALLRLLDDPAFASELGAAGQARAYAEYGEPVFLSRMLEVYSTALRRLRPDGRNL